MQCNLSNIRIKPNKKADPGTPAVRIDRRYNIDGGLTYRRWGADPPPLGIIIVPLVDFSHFQALE